MNNLEYVDRSLLYYEITILTFVEISFVYLKIFQNIIVVLKFVSETLKKYISEMKSVILYVYIDIDKQF